MREEACFKWENNEGKGQRGKKAVSGFFTANTSVLMQHKRLSDLLLAGANALRVQVPVGVEIADGHPQVLHGDHRAIGQVWEGGRQCRV